MSLIKGNLGDIEEITGRISPFKGQGIPWARVIKHYVRFAFLFVQTVQGI